MCNSQGQATQNPHQVQVKVRETKGDCSTPRLQFSKYSVFCENLDSQLIERASLLRCSSPDQELVVRPTFQRFEGEQPIVRDCNLAVYPTW
eukprot:1182212-Prorocentrum_minimum.AAC.1